MPRTRSHKAPQDGQPEVNPPEKITEAHPDIASALRSAGLQVTAQRLAVFRAVLASPHANADDISGAAKQEIGVISRQAVYDALNVMTEHGIIRRIQLSGSAACYEHSADSHHHIVCQQCGALADVDCVSDKVPCLTPRDTKGYLIEEAEITYWGVCPACQ